MAFIYKIANTINDKIYIGKTERAIQDRWYEHIKNAKNNSQCAIHRAMRKYGIENFYIIPIEQCKKEILNEREIYWIKTLNTFDKDYGYNMTLGGEGAAKKDYQKIFEAWNDGLTIQELEEKFSATRHTITNALKSLGITELEIKTRSLGIKIEQYSLEGEFIQCFDSIRQAAQIVGNTENITNIRNVAQQNTRSAYNYLWKYKDDPTPISEWVKKYNKSGKGKLKQVEKYSLEGKYICSYNSCREAARDIGAPYHVGISSCCLGKQKTAYGFKWRYAN